MTGAPSTGRMLWVALARAANALFFLLTSTYCVLTYSSFAYQQFIRPRMVSSLAGFVAFHHLWHWLLLAVTVATLLPEWRASRGRVVAWTYVAAMTAIGLAILYRPVLPSVENDALGLWLACAFLIPPIWLAVYDHLATASTFEPTPVDTRRLVIGAAAAGATVWAVNAASAPLHFGDLGDYTTSSAALIFGAGVSLAVHVGVFTIAGVMLAIAVGLAAARSSSALRQYWAIAIATALLVVAVVKTLVFASLSFTGAAAWVLAAAVALAITTTWSAAALRIVSGRLSRSSALEAWLAPLPLTAGRSGAWAGLIALPLVMFAVLKRIETFDWNFLVQSLCVLASWLVTASLVHTLLGRRRDSHGKASPAVLTASLAIVALAGVSAGGRIETTLPGSRQFVPEFVLDAYATVDPSYRLIRQLLASDPPGAKAFFSHLSDHTLIQHVDVKPVDVDFVRPLTPAPARPPHIFFFVIDSLRRDYISAYNPTVTFTPAFGQFAREGFAFQRAFTRYGGTGLSMPAMWAGSMLLHKEYVLPFQPMNALEKLITVNGYRPVMSMDHITAQIVDPALVVDELDRGRDEMQYDFCGTLEELQGKLNRGIAARQPVFAHTRSLNLHISKLTVRVGAPDAAYGGFQAPAAAAVRRMDGCFGRFITYLKDRDLYDDSIVVVTSDHGDALGEARRWGHSYTLFPEIVRTPLLMHIPATLRARFTAEVDAASFSTDITPSLYALLGYPSGTHQWPLGRSLFVPPGTDTSWRRREPALLASSYGPDYAVLSDNGEALYIADGVNSRDYAYDLSELKARRVGVTPQMRSERRAFIAARLDTLASLYHFTAPR
jgi:hypothetical protein